MRVGGAGIESKTLFPSPPIARGNYLLALTQLALLSLVLLLWKKMFIISVLLVGMPNVGMVLIPSSISGTAPVQFYFLAAPPRPLLLWKYILTQNK